MKIERTGRTDNTALRRGAARKIPNSIGFALILESMMALRETHNDYARTEAEINRSAGREHLHRSLLKP